MKPVVIIGVVIACSIFALSIGLSAEKIFPNQETLENENEEFEKIKQGELLSESIEEPIEDTTDEIKPISTIEIEIYGDKFDFSAEKYDLFAFNSAIPEYAIGNNLGDFLMSYGLSLDDQCLVFVYDNNSFCTNNSNTLTYFINDNPVSNIAFYQIEHGQKIEIKYQNNWNANSNSLEEAIDFQSKRVAEAENKIDEQNKKIENAKKPQVTINKGKVEMTLFDSKNNEYFWTMPVSLYDKFVKWDKVPTTSMLFDSGEVIKVGDFRPFVGTNFQAVIDDVYDNLESPDYFVFEIWYMVSALTIYSIDIGEDPSFAIETIVRGEGDCEDTVILIADMLRSSSHTKDWEIKLIYFDSDNPTNPQNINHVALSIDEGDGRYIIETTAKTIEDFTMWDNIDIIGWSLDV